MDRSSYSCPHPGEATTSWPQLASEFLGLAFAGEHACPGFFGYMEGALESGINAVLRVHG